jgi:NTE family protein
MAERGVVLALGGGGARGLAHIGVIEVLAGSHIPVRAVAGTSVGAEIGAFLARGMPAAEMFEVATAFDWKLTLQLFLPDLPTGGLVSGKKILTWLSDKLGGDATIEGLPIPYAAVAADLETGEEVVLDRGPLAEAVRARISLPGTLAPWRRPSRRGGRRRGRSSTRSRGWSGRRAGPGRPGLPGNGLDSRELPSGGGSSGGLTSPPL